MFVALIGSAFAWTLGPPPAVGISRRARTCVAQEGMAQMATSACDTLMGMLADGTEMPKAMIPVKEAVQSGDDAEISKQLYKLLVEQTLDYDSTEEGMLVPTTVDYSKTDDPKVKEKMTYIYSYGITMFKRDMIGGEALKEIVLSDIAGRVNMSGEEFDKWLEIPAV